MLLTDATTVLAVDLGGSKLDVGLVTLSGEVLASHRQLLIGLPYTPEVILPKIAEAIDHIRAQVSDYSPRAMGISIPAACNADEGVLFQNFSTGISGWAFKKELEAAFRLPVMGDNDVNACALAEKAFGCCKDVTDFLWVTVSFGCGGALFLRNQLYRGVGYLAGEVGHIQVEHQSPARCGCGVWGDMEAEGAGTAIGRKYLERTGKPADPFFRSKEVAELARAGDQLARELFDQSGYYLGRLSAMAVNLLNLQKIVLGGGVAVYDFDLLKPGIDRALEEQLFPLCKGTFTVEKTALGYQASLLGASVLAGQLLIQQHGKEALPQ